MRVSANKFVKNMTCVSFAQMILDNSKNVERTSKRGYGMEIAVDDTYFFPADIIEDVEEPTEDEVTNNE
jgi:hypothetical protein